MQNIAQGNEEEVATVKFNLIVLNLIYRRLVHGEINVFVSSQFILNILDSTLFLVISRTFVHHLKDKYISIRG